MKKPVYGSTELTTNGTPTREINYLTVHPELVEGFLSPFHIVCEFVGQVRRYPQSFRRRAASCRGRFETCPYISIMTRYGFSNFNTKRSLRSRIFVTLKSRVSSARLSIVPSLSRRKPTLVTSLITSRLSMR